MGKKSAFDILQDNLSEFGLSPKTHASGHDFLLPRAAVKNKFVIAESGIGYFFASDSYGAGGRAAVSSTYTGIYIPADLPVEGGCSLFKKEKLDRFFVSGKMKTGVTYIDKALTVKSDGWNPGTRVTPEIVDGFLEFNRKNPPFKLLIRPDYISYLAPFAGKTLIGLETNRWIFQKKDLELLLGEGMNLLLKLKEQL